MRDLSWFQQIKKDLKKYSKIFEQKDRLSQSKASKVSLRDAHRSLIWLVLRMWRQTSLGEQKANTGPSNQHPQL